MPSNTYENWHWDYEHALSWMKGRKEECLEEDEVFIGLGSHSKNIVTLGRHTTESDIVNADALANSGVEVIHTDRGGGATLHGPGQIVLYPIFSLLRLNLSIPLVTHLLEESLISCLRIFSLTAHRISGQPGIFVNNDKIGSIGFRVSSGILTHGISLNVSNDLSLFSHIATCRKVNAAITSMAALGGENTDVHTIGRQLTKIVRTTLEQKS